MKHPLLLKWEARLVTAADRVLEVIQMVINQMVLKLTK